MRRLSAASGANIASAASATCTIRRGAIAIGR